MAAVNDAESTARLYVVQRGGLHVEVKQRSHQNLFLKPLLVKNGLERAKKGKPLQNNKACSASASRLATTEEMMLSLWLSSEPAQPRAPPMAKASPPGKPQAHIHLAQTWVLLLPNPVLLCQTTKRCGSMVLLAGAT